MVISVQCLPEILISIINNGNAGYYVYYPFLTDGLLTLIYNTFR